MYFEPRKPSISCTCILGLYFKCLVCCEIESITGNEYSMVLLIDCIILLKIFCYNQIRAYFYIKKDITIWLRSFSDAANLFGQVFNLFFCIINIQFEKEICPKSCSSGGSFKFTYIRNILLVINTVFTKYTGCYPINLIIKIISLPSLYISTYIYMIVYRNCQESSFIVQEKKFKKFIGKFKKVHELHSTRPKFDV
jgi:hypothetical protein